MPFPHPSSISRRARGKPRPMFGGFLQARVLMTVKSRLAGEIKQLGTGLQKGSLSQGPVTGASMQRKSKQLHHM